MMFYDVNLSNIKIKASQDTANKLKFKYTTLTNDNFEIMQ